MTGDTCSLDVADRGEHTLEAVSDLLGGQTRERMRQIEERATAKLRRRMPAEYSEPDTLEVWQSGR